VVEIGGGETKELPVRGGRCPDAIYLQRAVDPIYVGVTLSVRGETSTHI